MSREFVYIAYEDGTEQHRCYEIRHPKLVGEYVLIAWLKKTDDGYPAFDYSVIHFESGAIVGHGDEPEDAISGAVKLIEDKGPEIIGQHIQEHLDRKAANEAREEEFRRQLIEGARNRPSRQGAVYLISAAGRYKIGQSLNPDQRISGMTLPEKPQVLVIHYTPKYREAEREIHLRFAHKRGHGEWFDFTTEELPEVEKAIRAF